MTSKKGNPRGIFERPAGSGVWWIRWHDAQGRRHREKAGTKATALKLYTKRKQQALERAKLPELHRRGPSFGELAQDALAYCRQHHRNGRNVPPHMARFLGWWKDRPADSLTPGEIEQRLVSVKWAPATFNRARALLSLTYNLGIRAGKVSANPAQRVQARKERNVRQGFITDTEYSALARSGGPLWLRTMLALGFTYGWRAGELLGLRVRQVNLAERTIRLEPGTTKNAEGRTVQLTAECFELVKACATGKGSSAPLFTHEDGRPVRAYRYAWETLCVKAGLGRVVCRSCGAAGRPCPDCGRRAIYAYRGLLFHDLRRSAVRNLERAGVPRSVAMKITGHRTEATFRRYAIVSPADLADATRKLEAARVEGAPQGAPNMQPQETVAPKPV